MLALSMVLLGAFVIAAILTEDPDDDDWGGGKMIPATLPGDN